MRVLCALCCCFHLNLIRTYVEENLSLQYVSQVLLKVLFINYAMQPGTEEEVCCDFLKLMSTLYKIKTRLTYQSYKHALGVTSYLPVIRLEMLKVLKG